MCPRKTELAGWLVSYVSTPSLVEVLVSREVRRVKTCAICFALLLVTVLALITSAAQAKKPDRVFDSAIHDIRGMMIRATTDAAIRGESESM
jgi:hypothetical protein